MTYLDEARKLLEVAGEHELAGDLERMESWQRTAMAYAVVSIAESLAVLVKTATAPKDCDRKNTGRTGCNKWGRARWQHARPRLPNRTTNVNDDDSTSKAKDP
jgi:hypothetical protein